MRHVGIGTVLPKAADSWQMAEGEPAGKMPLAGLHSLGTFSSPRSQRLRRCPACRSLCRADVLMGPLIGLCAWLPASQDKRTHAGSLT
jgi:hypothetical protein